MSVCARTFPVCVCLKEGRGGEQNGMFVSLVRFVIGCSVPHRSLPELIICMDSIDNRAAQGGHKFYSH